MSYELGMLYSSRVRRSTEFAGGVPWQRARVAAIAAAMWACTKFNWRLIGRTCDSLLIGTLRRRRRGRPAARETREGETIVEIAEETLRKKKIRQYSQKDWGGWETRKDDKAMARRIKKIRHEILSRMNQAVERVLFLARIYAPRRSSTESRRGVFRSRCGWVSIPNIDVRLFSREPTPYGGAPPADRRSPSAQYELDFIEGTSIDPTGNWYIFLTRPFPDHSTEQAIPPWWRDCPSEISGIAIAATSFYLRGCCLTF